MGISRPRRTKNNKSVISAGGREHNSEEDPHCNMATTEIEIECSESPCMESGIKPSEDENYCISNDISNCGESMCQCKHSIN